MLVVKLRLTYDYVTVGMK